mmetsp:Transcript_20808/g.66985  ORF Transcript_20808/g.66985 Transcript_20808/m.66985 type:complete len:209 (-) Transcript_20808:263-889(-)
MVQDEGGDAPSPLRNFGQGSRPGRGRLPGSRTARPRPRKHRQRLPPRNHQPRPSTTHAHRQIKLLLSSRSSSPTEPTTHVCRPSLPYYKRKKKAPPPVSSFINQSRKKKKSDHHPRRKKERKNEQTRPKKHQTTRTNAPPLLTRTSLHSLTQASKPHLPSSGHTLLLSAPSEERKYTPSLATDRPNERTPPPTPIFYTPVRRPRLLPH